MRAAGGGAGRRAALRSPRRVGGVDVDGGRWAPVFEAPAAGLALRRRGRQTARWRVEKRLRRIVHDVAKHRILLENGLTPQSGARRAPDSREWRRRREFHCGGWEFSIGFRRGCASARRRARHVDTASCRARLAVVQAIRPAASGRPKGLPYDRRDATPVHTHRNHRLGAACLAERVCRIGQFAPLILVRLTPINEAHHAMHPQGGRVATSQTRRQFRGRGAVTETIRPSDRSHMSQG
jgi:hypothetical protein